MANETTTTSVASLLPSIVAEAMFVAQEQSIMRNLVKNYSVPFGSGLTVNVPIYAAAPVASTPVEGIDLANSEVQTTNKALVVATRGIMTTITDLARNGASSNIITDIGGLFGRSIANAIDTNLIALFAAMNGGTSVGDGTANINADDFFRAAAILRTSNASGSLSAVISPAMAYDLKKDLLDNHGTTDLTNEALRAGYVGHIAGIAVYESSLATTGAVFGKEALGLAVMQDITIETQRDASLRANELVATAIYGVGELQDTHGVSFDMTVTNLSA